MPGSLALVLGGTGAGARSKREGAAIPIAWDDRLEAGFSEEELEELAQIAGEGPSRKTLSEAAHVIRKHHHARLAGSQPAAS